jgi:hypothetical protein
MANFFLCGNYHSCSDYQALYHGLVRLGHDVFRGYNYENEDEWDEGSQWFFTPDEIERFKRLEAVSDFRFDDYVDRWGRVGGKSKYLLLETNGRFRHGSDIRVSSKHTPVLDAGWERNAFRGAHGDASSRRRG